MTRYREIADALIAAIHDGGVAVGDLLPGELHLMRHYTASRHTIRAALRRLEELGLVERRRGLGTRVVARSARRSYVHRVASPGELLQYPAQSRLRVLEVRQLSVTAAAARLLGCRSASRWVRIRTLREMQGRQPICRTDIYLLPRYASVAKRIGSDHRSVYQLLEDSHGVHVAEVVVDVTARAMPEDAASVLGVAPDSPSMTVVRRYLDEDGRPFQITVSDHPGDRYAFSQRLRRDWESGWTVQD
jgi:DNA-binding GntR family transcriptional regulator